MGSLTLFRLCIMTIRTNTTLKLLIFLKKSGKTHPTPPRFIRNWNVKGKKRIQNADVGNISEFTSETITLLGLDKNLYSNHSWRRSAATNLANSGISLTNLKCHGQWASDPACEGFIAQSRPLKIERLTCLMPDLSLEDRKPPPGSQALTVKDEIMEDLEDVSKKRKRHIRHTGITQPDKLTSNEEAYLENEDGEPVVKKRGKKSGKKCFTFQKRPWRSCVHQLHCSHVLQG